MYGTRKDHKSITDIVTTLPTQLLCGVNIFNTYRLSYIHSVILHTLYWKCHMLPYISGCSEIFQKNQWLQLLLWPYTSLYRWHGCNITLLVNLYWLCRIKRVEIICESRIVFGCVDINVVGQSMKHYMKTYRSRYNLGIYFYPHRTRQATLCYFVCEEEIHWMLEVIDRNLKNLTEEGQK